LKWGKVKKNCREAGVLLWGHVEGQGVVGPKKTGEKRNHTPKR